MTKRLKLGDRVRYRECYFLNRRNRYGNLLDPIYEMEMMMGVGRVVRVDLPPPNAGRVTVEWENRPTYSHCEPCVLRLVKRGGGG